MSIKECRQHPKTEKGKDSDSPLKASAGTSLAATLPLDHRNRFWMYNLQNSKIINVCGFKPLNGNLF